MGQERLIEVQLGVLLNLCSQAEEGLNRGITRHKILGPRAKGDDFQSSRAQKSPGNGQEFTHHLRHRPGVTHRCRRDIGADASQLQVIAGVEQTAVGVAPALQQVLPALLCGGGEHHRTAERLGKQGLRRFGPEVAEINGQGVGPRRPELSQGGAHVVLVLHDGPELIELPVTGAVGLRHPAAAVL